MQLDTCTSFQQPITTIQSSVNRPNQTSEDLQGLKSSTSSLKRIPSMRLKLDKKSIDRLTHYAWCHVTLHPRASLSLLNCISSAQTTVSQNSPCHPTQSHQSDASTPCGRQWASCHVQSCCSCQGEIISCRIMRGWMGVTSKKASPLEVDMKWVSKSLFWLGPAVT